jgi:hypothetical protein
MTRGFTVDRPFHVAKGRRGRKELREGGPGPVSAGRVPRVARLMALAVHFDQLIGDGIVADQAQLARLGRVTHARLTQNMDLPNLINHASTLCHLDTLVPVLRTATLSKPAFTSESSIDASGLCFRNTFQTRVPWTCCNIAH